MIGQLSTGLHGWVSATASRTNGQAPCPAAPAGVPRASEGTTGVIPAAANCGSSDRVRRADGISRRWWNGQVKTPDAIYFVELIVLGRRLPDGWQDVVVHNLEGPLRLL